MNEIESFIEFIVSLVSENIYPGVFVAALIETVFPPIPSEAVFPLAGYSILKNNMNVFHIFGVGVTGGAGATLGAFVIYIIAKGLGRVSLVKYLKYAKIKEYDQLRLKTKKFIEFVNNHLHRKSLYKGDPATNLPSPKHN